MQFVGRTDKVNIISNMLQLKKNGNCIWFVLRGDSGSGKTHLIRSAVANYASSSDSAYCIYLDVSADEFVSSNFFQNLIQQAYLPIKYHDESITIIPKPLSFYEFLKRSSTLSEITKDFKTVTSALISSIPVVGNIATLPWDSAIEWLHSRQFSAENLFFNYLASVVSKQRVNIIIDNYQFLPPIIKRQFESSMNLFHKGITVVTLVRTPNSASDLACYCDEFEKYDLLLEYASKEECEALIRAQDINLSKVDIEKIWSLTRGNLKNVDMILNELRVNPGYGIISTYSAIASFDIIQKTILWITAMFPAGMRESYVIYAIQDILSEDDNEKIHSQINFLIDLGYIYLNSSTNDSIKPTHETVINNIRDATDLRDFAQFRVQMALSLENLIYNNGKTAEYSYLIHCWIGVSTVEELIRNINIVEELIAIKFKENAYYYIDDIILKNREISCFFDEIILRKILIAFQRVSDFQSGLSLLHELKLKNLSAYKALKIFNAKFLIQTYNFEDALTILNELEVCSETLLCTLNALQHLGRDHEAKILLEENLHKCVKDESYYVILRNTAHFYDYSNAMNNLIEALQYFKQRSFSEFAKATVHNNIGVVYLWKRNYELAESHFTQAVIALEELKSNEVFEPYCNLGVSAMLVMDYVKASGCTEKALLHCPKTLTLDLLMLQINTILIDLCAGKINFRDALSRMLMLSKKYSIIEDPWYLFQLNYNIKELEHALGDSQQDVSSAFTSQYHDGRTKYYILEAFQISGYSINLCLGLSPNWRY